MTRTHTGHPAAGRLLRYLTIPVSGGALALTMTAAAPASAAVPASGSLTPVATIPVAIHGTRAGRQRLTRLKDPFQHHPGQPAPGLKRGRAGCFRRGLCCQGKTSAIKLNSAAVDGANLRGIDPACAANGKIYLVIVDNRTVTFYDRFTDRWSGHDVARILELIEGEVRVVDGCRIVQHRILAGGRRFGSLGR